MDCYPKLPGVSKRSRKKFKYHKPFWCEELTDLWVDMRDNENAFKKTRYCRNHWNEAFLSFMSAQKSFNKQLRNI